MVPHVGSITVPWWEMWTVDWPLGPVTASCMFQAAAISLSLSFHFCSNDGVHFAGVSLFVQRLFLAPGMHQLLLFLASICSPLGIPPTRLLYWA